MTKAAHPSLLRNARTGGQRRPVGGHKHCLSEPSTSSRAQDESRPVSTVPTSIDPSSIRLSRTNGTLQCARAAIPHTAPPGVNSELIPDSGRVRMPARNSLHPIKRSLNRSWPPFTRSGALHAAAFSCPANPRGTLVGPLLTLLAQPGISADCSSLGTAGVYPSGSTRCTKPGGAESEAGSVRCSVLSEVPSNPEVPIAARSRALKRQPGHQFGNRIIQAGQAQ